MKLEETTLYEWRKSIGSSFTHHAGACMNLIDALSSLHGAKSIVELSLSPLHERGYASINNAISSYYKPRNMSHEDAIYRKKQVDRNIENTLCQYLDKDEKYHAFAGDATPRKRPHAKKLPDRSCVYSPNNTPGNKPIVIGHSYLTTSYLLRDYKMALPLRISRIQSSEKESSKGVEEWLEIIKDPKNQFSDKPCVGVFDAKYSNAYGLDAYQRHKPFDRAVIFCARLRGDRALERPAVGEKQNTKGRNPRYDYEHPFKLKNDDTWGNPIDKTDVQWENRLGHIHDVHIQAWDGILMKSHHACTMPQETFSVIRISVTDNSGKLKYKNPLWLLLAGPWQEYLTLTDIWDLYRKRFDIEKFFRFAKQCLLMDSYQTPDAHNEENFMTFVSIAMHQLYHCKDIANLVPRQWETSCKNHGGASLPAAKARRDMHRVLSNLPMITGKPVVRGLSLGRKVGASLSNRKDNDVVYKKGLKHKNNREINIKCELLPNNEFQKPRIKCVGVDPLLIPQEINDLFLKMQGMKINSGIPPD